MKFYNLIPTLLLRSYIVTTVTTDYDLYFVVPYVHFLLSVISITHNRSVAGKGHTIY